jgi:alpha-beta hydrolase superfamily lysophospholipase
MRTLILAAACAALLGVSSASAHEFEARSADGTTITGVADIPDRAWTTAVVFVPGTGLFNRAGQFGKSGTPRDAIFKDLADRLLNRGIAAVRYDLRGVGRVVPTPDMLNKTLLAGRTTDNMRDDLAAVYAWTRSADGLGARCIIFFVHSEGMLHVARLAPTGAPAPALIIGMGAAMQSPAVTLRWQMTGRTADSLEQMDADGNGITTNDEVKANIKRTPSGVYGVLEPFLHPNGRWTADDIAQLRQTQTALYEKHRAETLAQPDAAPYPNSANPFSAYQWWKSWFVDEMAAGAHLSKWTMPVILHYGDQDSQTPAGLQIASAKTHIPADRLTVHIHAGRGHSLGPDVLFGPVDETIADQIADEAANAICK